MVSAPDNSTALKTCPGMAVYMRISENTNVYSQENRAEEAQIPVQHISFRGEKHHTTRSNGEYAKKAHELRLGWRFSYRGKDKHILGQGEHALARLIRGHNYT